MIWRAVVAASIVLLVAGASIHSVCDLYFDCGCAPLWSGGVEHCNIHDPLPPDCPWCTGSTFYAVAAFLAAGIFAGIYLGARLSERLAVQLALGFAGYVLASFAASFL